MVGMGAAVGGKRLPGAGSFPGQAETEQLGLW